MIKCGGLIENLHFTISPCMNTPYNELFLETSEGVEYASLFWNVEKQPFTDVFENKVYWKETPTLVNIETFL